MKFKPVKLAPLLIAVGVIALVCLLQLFRLDFFERLERITYDQRVRIARNFPQPTATNLGAVFISDDSITAINDGSLGFRYGLYWPRHIYGRVLRELSEQGATTVAFDVLLKELRIDHSAVPVVTTNRPDITAFLAALHPGQEAVNYEDGGEQLTLVQSDDYFTWQLRRSGAVILAAEQGVLPNPLFATNAASLGDISADRDADGVLRRARAFGMYRRWHPLFRQVESDPGYGVDLSKSRIEKGRIVLIRSNGEEIKVPVDAENNFEVADFVGEKLPPGVTPKAKAFTDTRVWHMGIVLAARELKIDLAAARVEPDHGRIIFHGQNGAERILPVDGQGYFFINWELPINDPRLTQGKFEELLRQDLARSDGLTNGLTTDWKNKLVVIGSSATGNDLADRGATPMEKDTFLVSKHWNVANSLITARFVRRASLGTELVIIVLLGALTAFLTWQLRVFSAAVGVLVLALAYFGVAIFLYVQHRYWLPIVLPCAAIMLVEHISLMAYRVVFEQAAGRRIKSLFSQVVSPNIVNVLVNLEKLSLGGSRREVTVFFADVRGFTELTDTNQKKAEAFVRDHKLSEAAANAYFDEEARETLNTVNLYLALVADMVKKHDGTLDKYIGDCVMAFWGAPTPNSKHALACVQAAIDAQRAIYEVNQRRAVESQKLEIENRARVSAGLTPKPLLPTLALGSGINTGQVTVGLMGSEAHIRNYTVFGPEVNLASRLEGVSGHDRIVIGETTYQHLLRDDPALASRCIELEPTKPKGFKNPVKNYEVPWRLPDTTPERRDPAPRE